MKCKKIPYTTRKEVTAMMKFHGELKSGKPYLCSFCGKWHLGNKIPRKSDAGKIERIGRLKRRGMKILFRVIEDLCGVDD